MADAATVIARLKVVGADQAKREMGGFRSGLTDIGAVARRVAIPVAALGAAFFGLAKITVGAAQEQIRAERTLAQVVNNSGTAWDDVKDSILATTAALQNKTNFGDEEQLRVLSRLIPIIGSYEKAMQALPVVLDASTVSGSSAISIAGTLGRALAGEVNTAESLGLTFEKDATFLERLNVAQAVAGGAAEANADSFVQFGNAVGDLQESIGKALLPVMIPLVKGFTSLVQTIGPLVEKFAALVFTSRNWETVLAGMTGTLAALDRVTGGFFGTLLQLSGAGEENASIFSRLGGAISTWASDVAQSFGRLTVATRALKDEFAFLAPLFVAAAPVVASAGVALTFLNDQVDLSGVLWGILIGALGPAGSILANLPSLIDGVALALKLLNDASAIAQSVWASMTSFMSDNWASFAAFIVPSLAGITLALQNIMSAFDFSLRDIWNSLWTSLSAFAQETWDTITQGWSDFIGFWTESWTEVSEFVLETAQSIWDGIQAGWDAFSEPFMVGWTGLAEFLSGLWASIESLAASSWQGIQDVIVGVINTIIDKINSFINSWNNLEFRVPGLPGLPGFTVGTPDIGLIPRLAHGTPNFAGGLAIVGERGPELLNLPGGSAVKSNADLRGMGGSTVVNITVPINGPVYGAMDLDRLVQGAVGRAFRDGKYRNMVPQSAIQR